MGLKEFRWTEVIQFVNHMIPLLMWKNWHWFSSNRPTGRIRSSSRIVCVCVCVCVCLFVPFHVVYFEAYFAPTSQSRMSKVFRDSESLGKSAGKKRFQNWTFLLWSGLKSPRKKSFFFVLILPYKTWWKPRFPWIKDIWSKGI